MYPSKNIHATSTREAVPTYRPAEAADEKKPAATESTQNQGMLPIGILRKLDPRM